MVSQCMEEESMDGNISYTSKDNVDDPIYGGILIDGVNEWSVLDNNIYTNKKIKNNTTHSPI